MYDALFQPLQVRRFTLRNRVVMPPMVTNMGLVTEQAVAWYRERARGGVALVIVESTSLDRLQDPELRNGLPRLVEAVREEGAHIAMQLSLPATVHGEAVSVSGTEEASAISSEEIHRAVARFAEAAALLKRLGFDGVEPHGAHGFFLNQFFSPLHNRRLDGYGGSLESRMRLGLEIVRAIRDSVGDDLLLLYRHTPDEQAPEGYGLEDSLVFAERLKAEGLDILDVSPSTRARSDHHAGMAGALRKAVGIPTIAVGGMKDPEVACAALEEGKCDLVAVGRGLITDAHWARKIQEGRIEEMLWCVECNERCFGHLRLGLPIGCKVNVGAGSGLGLRPGS